MAEDEEDATLIREAVAWARKVAKVSNEGRYMRREFLEVAPLKFGAQNGPGFVQPTIQVWGPVFPQPQLNQNVQFQPIFKRRSPSFVKEPTRRDKTYLCRR